jgi:hypothetical protein
MNGIIICGHEFEPAPDKWDRIYYVDFFLKVKQSYIGIQIKPTTFGGSGVPTSHKRGIRDGHRKFQLNYRGKVFIITRKTGNDPVSEEICSEIREEIERLSRL